MRSISVLEGAAKPQVELWDTDVVSTLPHSSEVTGDDGVVVTDVWVMWRNRRWREEGLYSRPLKIPVSATSVERMNAATALGMSLVSR